MFSFQKWSVFLMCFGLVSGISAQLNPFKKSSNFEVHELNRNDAQEVEQVCALFEDEDNRRQTTCDADEMKHYIHSPLYKIFVSKTKSAPAVVTGVLMAVYMRNGIAPEGYSNYVEWDHLTPRYRKTVDDAICFGTIAVHPDYRRQGVASTLMQNVEQFCVDFGMENVVISTFKYNDKAKNCYQKQGFNLLEENYFTFKWYKKLEIPVSDTPVDQSALFYALSSFHE